MIQWNPWISIKDKAPPYDDLVLLRGDEEVESKWIDGWTNEEHCETVTISKYAIAFNQCYPPDICMTQVVEVTKDDKPNLATSYPNIAFKITHWMRIPE